MDQWTACFNFFIWSTKRKYLERFYGDLSTRVSKTFYSRISSRKFKECVLIKSVIRLNLLSTLICTIVMSSISVEKMVNKIV